MKSVWKIRLVQTDSATIINVNLSPPSGEHIN